MLYSKGGIYHAIYQWYIAMCTVVYTLLYNTALLLCYKLFNTAPVLCYKLFNTAHCYVTSYLTLLYNMLIHTFWTARALPACLAIPPCPGFVTFAQHCLFTARQGHCLLLVTISITHTICPTGPLLGVVALGEVRGNIELLENRGEARVQLVHPSPCSRVLRQGFNVGHKNLGDVRGPGKRDEVLGGLYG